jgi:hypothetical protein
VSQPPTIDGALDEDLWAQAPSLTTFVQAEPHEGQPASQPTDVRLAYADTAIYIGVTCNFTPSLLVQSLIQYNDRTERWSTNLRFHWLQTAGTGLFVVCNDTESLQGLGPVSRAFIVKYVQQFDLLQ